MDATALWQRYQDWLYYHEGLGFYLDISRMGFDDAFVTQMQPKFTKKAFEDMAALEAGAIANPDENRMVGHYWLRDPELAPTPELKQDILDTLVSIEQFASQVRTGGIYPPGQEHFTDILSIGIGGSALGPQFVAHALGPDFPPLNIHFIDNTDPGGHRPHPGPTRRSAADDPGDCHLQVGRHPRNPQRHARSPSPIRATGAQLSQAGRRRHRSRQHLRKAGPGRRLAGHFPDAGLGGGPYLRTVCRRATASGAAKH